MALAVSALFFFSAVLLAQEKTIVSIQTIRDGEVVLDTTYRFEDVKKAEHALELLEIMSHEPGDHTKTLVVVTEDGKKTKIKEIESDSLVWVSEDECDGKHVKIMKVKVDEDGEMEEDVHVIVYGDEEGEWSVIEKKLDEKDEGDEVEVIVIKKKVKEKDSKKQ